MSAKGCGPRNLGVPKGSPFKLDPATVVKVAGMAKEAKGGGGEKAAPKKEEVGDIDPFAGVPYRGTPLKACWKTGGPGNQGYVQRGMKKKGNRTVPNCVPKASAK